MSRNILFTYVPNSDVSNFINEHLNNTTDIYSKRIAFLGETGQIMTHGELFAISMLSDNYEMSELINSSLLLEPQDTFETALGKLEKAIIDNEKVATNALIYLDENKLDTSLISAVGLSNDYNDLDNLPIIPSLTGFATEEYVDTSVNNLKDYIDSSLILSSEYIMSSSVNDDLNLLPGDRFETAFSKLEKSIIDNEEVITNALNTLNTDKVSIDDISNILGDYTTETYVNNSIQTLKDYVDSSLSLSSEYVMSSSTNEELHLLPNDSFETAFSKLEKIIYDDELVISNTINYLGETKLDSSLISLVGLSNDYNDLDNLPVIPSLTGFATEEYVDTSVNNLKDYIDSSVNMLREYVDSSLVLSDEYVMSSSINDDLQLLPGDRFETAFSKLEKSLIDNEYVITQEFLELSLNKLDTSSLSAVGLSNDYNDLDNKPLLVLSSSYVMSSSLNTELHLQPGDNLDIAFGKLEKALHDDEYVLTQSILEIKDTIDSSVITAIDQVEKNTLDISAINTSLYEFETVLIHYLEGLDISILNIMNRLETLENNS